MRTAVRSYAFFWGGFVAQAVVDGCGSFWEGVVEHGVMNILLFVCICGYVLQSCEEGFCKYLLRSADRRQVDL